MTGRGGRGRGRGRGARGGAISGGRGGSKSITLNARFSAKNFSNPASGRRVRRVVATQRGGASRFANVMSRRTGQQKTAAPVRRSQAVRGKRGGGATRARGARGAGRGRGSARGRGRGRGGKLTQEALDKELDSYMNRSEKKQKEVLDDELDSYMQERNDAKKE